jgi:hypothetical protein
MAVQLPDFTQVAGVRTGQEDVAPGSIIPTYYGTSPEAEALAASGAALGKLGTGLQTLGTAAATLAGHERMQTNMVNSALAQMDLHTKLARNQAKINASNNPQEIDQLYNEQQGHLDSASQLIPDPDARAQWIAHHTKDVVAAQLDAEKRQREVYSSNALAGTRTLTEDAAKRYARSDDPAVREQAMNDLHTYYDWAKKAGVLRPDQIQIEHKAALDMWGISPRRKGRPGEAPPFCGRASTAASRFSGTSVGGASGRAPIPKPRQRCVHHARLRRGRWRAPAIGINSRNIRHQTSKDNKLPKRLKQAGRQRRLLGTSGGHGLTTIRQLISHPKYGYAPDTEIGNRIDSKTGEPKDLVGDAAKRVGIGPDDPIDLKDPAMREKMTQAIVAQEGKRVISPSGATVGGPVVQDFQTRVGETVAHAAESGIILKPGQSSRTHEEQQKLYDAYEKRGFTGPPVAKPGTSQHEKALANDFHDAQGNTIKAGSAEDRWLQANLEDHGLHRPVKGEPWHIRADRRADSIGDTAGLQSTNRQDGQRPRPVKSPPAPPAATVQPEAILGYTGPAVPGIPALGYPTSGRGAGASARSASASASAGRPVSAPCSRPQLTRRALSDDRR